MLLLRYEIMEVSQRSLNTGGLKPQSYSPPFATTVAAAALQLYQVDQVHQPWGLRMGTTVEQIISMNDSSN